MTINFKPNDQVWLFKDNKPTTRTVRSVAVTRVFNNEEPRVTYELEENKTQGPETTLKVRQELVFATKAELIQDFLDRYQN